MKLAAPLPRIWHAKLSPFRYFKTSPEVIRLAVMLYIQFPLSLRNVEDLLRERIIEISHETVRYWWNRFGPMFAAEIRGKRVDAMRAYHFGAEIAQRVAHRVTDELDRSAWREFVPQNRKVGKSNRSVPKCPDGVRWQQWPPGH